LYGSGKRLTPSCPRLTQRTRRSQRTRSCRRLTPSTPRTQSAQREEKVYCSLSCD